MIKEIETENMTDGETQAMMNEISIMQKTNSHFVVGYIDSYSEDTKIYIVMEYC